MISRRGGRRLGVWLAILLGAGLAGLRAQALGAF
jgi:hypothetical protein